MLYGFLPLLSLKIVFFFAKKNHIWMKLNKKKEFALSLLSPNCLNRTVWSKILPLMDTAYWAIHFSIHSFTCTAQSSACSPLLASLVRAAALICSFAHSRAHGKAVFTVRSSTRLLALLNLLEPSTAYVHLFVCSLAQSFTPKLLSFGTN